MSESIEVTKHEPTDISRRTFIKQLAVVFAGALTATSIEAAISGHTQEADNDKRKHLAFNAQQFALVKHLAEMIIPETDTPGAIGADVHGFMDYQVANCFTKQEREKFLSGLDEMDQVVKRNHGKSFLYCDTKTQTRVLISIEKQSNGFGEQHKSFFKQFKALTLLGYYTSKVGATQELAYLAVPGGYRGSLPFETIGKAWTL